MSNRTTAIPLTRWAECAGCAAKMDATQLAGLLQQFPLSQDPSLLVGLHTGDDAGVYRIAEHLALVNTVDFFPPVVDDPFSYGQIAAANALSDVYAMGGRPVTALNIVTFPREGLPITVLHEILRGGQSKLEEAGVALVGGHTVTDAQIKYGLAVTGLIEPKHIISNAGARPGDWLLLTKPIGIGVLTAALREDRLDAALTARVTAVMARLNRDAAQGMLECGAHACTDITGYGLLGHGLEMARASRMCLEIDHRSVPHFPEAVALCAQGVGAAGVARNRQAFSAAVSMAPDVSQVWQDLLFDPQTSGGLLIALPEAAAQMFLHRFGNEDIAIIGRVTDVEDAGIVVK